MNHSSSAEQQQFVQLQKLYIQSLPTKKEDIASALEAAKQDIANEQLLADLKMLVHRLAGSGGGYGFTQLSQAAREMELTIEDTETGDSVWSSVDEAFVKLCNVINQILATDGSSEL